MKPSRPLALTKTCHLPSDHNERHEALLIFGQFLFWLRNWSLQSSRTFMVAEAREKLGTIRRPHDGVARMSPEQREAMLLVEETLNRFANGWCGFSMMKARAQGWEADTHIAFVWKWRLWT